MRLFETFNRTAFRLETRGHYRVDEEAEALRRFLVGEPVDLGWFEPWLATIRQLSATDRTMQRVRLVNEPPTDYQRFELSVTPANIAAGEDIRVLTHSAAASLDLPNYDFWLFDDELVVVMHFGDDGAFLGAQTVAEPATVADHRASRARALSVAQSYHEYMTADPQRDRTR